MQFTELDSDYLESHTIWVAHLTNEMKAYESNYKSWIQLKSYLEENNVGIKRIEFRFRSNSVYLDLENNCYFSKGVGKFSTAKNSELYYIYGKRVGDKVICHWFRIPELVLFRVDEKKIEDCEPPFYIEW